MSIAAKLAQLNQLLGQAQAAQNESKGDPEVGHGQIDHVLLEVIKLLSQGTPYEDTAKQIIQEFQKTHRWYA